MDVQASETAPVGPDEAMAAATHALRWVMAAAVPADGGIAWPSGWGPESDQRPADDLYSGTAGILVGLAEARLNGLGEFDGLAEQAAGRLRALAAQATQKLLAAASAGGHGSLAEAELGLYCGLAGYAAALQIWADVTGDALALTAARDIVAGIVGAARHGRALSDFTDVVLGEAGVLLAILHVGVDGRQTDNSAGDVPDASDVLGVVAMIADRIAAQARWDDAEPYWLARDDFSYEMPNFSHGAAGVAYALASAGRSLGRPDLVALAESAGRRLVRLGTQADGTIAVPLSIPVRDPKTPIRFGWCHGPTGTLRLFRLLDTLRPGHGWDDCVSAAGQAARTSGLPARLYPGFWDNLGQCCGTAGVGEMALDRYQESGDASWLDWAGLLARDVVNRAIRDQNGVRWSHTEYRRRPPELPPEAGWMQGSAGIAGWLLRLARVQRDRDARRIRWPDLPWPDVGSTGPNDAAGTPASGG